MKGRAIIARGAPVALPRSLGLRPEYPTLAEIERRFLAAIAFQSPRTGSTYRDGMLRFVASAIRHGVYFHDYGGAACHHGFCEAMTSADVEETLRRLDKAIQEMEVAA